VQTGVNGHIYMYGNNVAVIARCFCV